jgi:hypothetical protein
MLRVRLLASAAILASGLVSGCAEAPAPKPRSAPLSADLAEWVGPAPAPADASTRRMEPSGRSVVALREDPGERYATRRIVPPREAPPRPRRHGRVNVSFQGADMVQALQFLADAGGFNLVMSEGLTGKVSATLRGVDPYDALVSLAEANGAKVVFDKRIVVVSKR